MKILTMAFRNLHDLTHAYIDSSSCIILYIALSDLADFDLISALGNHHTHSCLRVFMHTICSTLTNTSKPHHHCLLTPYFPCVSAQISLFLIMCFWFSKSCHVALLWTLRAYCSFISSISAYEISSLMSISQIVSSMKTGCRLVLLTTLSSAQSTINEHNMNSIKMCWKDKLLLFATLITTFVSPLQKMLS